MDTPQDGADHWRWRPDWSDDRACTFWYLTIPEGAVRLPALDAYAAQLDRRPWLDTVPPRWWHLTLTEIGYDDVLGPDLLADVAAAVAGSVAGRAPLELEVGPVVPFRTAIALAAGPDAGLRALQAQVRSCTQEVLGPDHDVVHPTRFRPHVSLAYLNRDVPAADVVDALADAPEARATLTLDRVSLASVRRRARHYEWEIVDEVRLGGEGPRG